MSQTRSYLFLQGPHGPFFAQIAKGLRLRGHSVLRVGFNMGDRVFWPRRLPFVKFTDPMTQWEGFCKNLIQRHEVTDIVIYGDVRAHHKIATQLAKAQGLRVHVFEEGYLRPFWITYEKDGSNGNSHLMQLTARQIAKRIDHTPRIRPVPMRWGELRQHIFYGALYHWFIIFLNFGYPSHAPHRPAPLLVEWRQYALRLATLPFAALRRAMDTSRFLRDGRPYHLVLLQLEHDSAFQAYSPFKTNEEFITHVIKEFAQHAPKEHRLLFKAHPLEARQIHFRRKIANIIVQQSMQNRVFFIGGGKIGKLLEGSKSVITVNSTAAQQALAKAIPVRVFGDAIYCKKEFISRQPLVQFFKKPAKPNMELYAKFRAYLLQHVQIEGGFYSRKGRARVLGSVLDRLEE